MRKRILLALALAGCLALPAADALAWRCGNLIVKKGTQKAAVSLYCGEPAYKERRDANSELWIYGPQSGVYRLVSIRHGEVAKVEMKRKL